MAITDTSFRFPSFVFVSFPVRPSPSKFSIIARTCLVPLETFGRIFLILPTTQRKHVTLPVSPILKKNCSRRARVHSRSEAVESRESMTFSESIQIPSVVKAFLSNSQIPLSCGLEYRLQALGTESKDLQNVFHVYPSCSRH